MTVLVTRISRRPYSDTVCVTRFFTAAVEVMLALTMIERRDLAVAAAGDCEFRYSCVGTHVYEYPGQSTRSRSWSADCDQIRLSASNVVRKQEKTLEYTTLRRTMLGHGSCDPPTTLITSQSDHHLYQPPHLLHHMIQTYTRPRANNEELSIR
jgi:hypothetical protein